jgi:hypothetical protein
MKQYGVATTYRQCASNQLVQLGWNRRPEERPQSRPQEDDKQNMLNLVCGWETLGSSLAPHLKGNMNTHSSLAPS